MMSFPSLLRPGGGRGEGVKIKIKMAQIKITAEKVATNDVASRPPNRDQLQRRPLVPIKGCGPLILSFPSLLEPGGWEGEGGKNKNGSNFKINIDICAF